MRVQLTVPDMSCNHCKMAIENAVSGVNDGLNCKVDLDDKKVLVEGELDIQTLVGAIKDAGYTVEEILDLK